MLKLVKTFTLLCILFSTSCFAQIKKPYQIFSAEGKKVSYQKLIKQLTKQDVVFFGELHNNSIAHWLEYEITYDLDSLSTKKLILGAEMFETDNQEVLNMYLQEKIDAKALDTLARLWNNFKTDYKPLVDFAQKKQHPFIATNVPRRYASLVYKNGLESLDSINIHEKKFIAPLPILYPDTLSSYIEMKKMMKGHGGENLPKAQALKDATMAYFIQKNLKKNSIFIHYNGSFHSKNHEGILWYLQQSNPNLKVKTIHITEQKNIDKVATKTIGIADYIIVTDKDNTKTY